MAWEGGIGTRGLPTPARAAGAARAAEADDETDRTWDRAQRVLASGLWSVSRGAHRYEDGIFPRLARRGSGCRLWDTSGREYVDWMIAWGPAVLGYRHPEVERAIRDQLAEGPLLSLLHPLEVEVAEALVDAVPCAERVAFGKNGSDVLGAAVRVARASTGREVVLHHGYHGFHDWYVAGQPGCAGVPASIRDLVHAFPLNDLAALRALLRRFEGRVAAIVLEPADDAVPEPGYLAAVKALAAEHGCVLVFDEIITGFRLARGGAQEAFGVVPDLACVGKALANGMPLSALVGRGDFMETLHRVGYGITYRGETLSLAAARACLRIHEREPVAATIGAIGAEVRARHHEARDRLGVGAALIGPDARQSFAFSGSPRIAPLGCQVLFVQECLKRGVLTNGSLLPSFAHDGEAVRRSVRVFEAALEVVARALDAGTLEGSLAGPVLPEYLPEGRPEGASA